MFQPGLCLKLLFYVVLLRTPILLLSVLAVLGLYDTLIILVYNNNKALADRIVSYRIVSRYFI